MLKKSLPIFLFILALSVPSVFAQRVYTPKKGSKQRKTILNAVRVPVQKELKQKIIFVVSDFNVSGSWAFVAGEPRAKNGGKPNYRGTKYEANVKDGLFDDNFFALLKKKGKRWSVVALEMGCTDVCYSNWWDSYKAPKRIFPYTE